MGLKSRQGVDMREHWNPILRSYFGMTFAGFPNAFMIYTQFSPAAFSNGTTIIETQCDIATTIVQKILDSEMDGRRIKSVEATPEAEDEWMEYVNAQNENTLFPLTESWWTGDSIPGKGAQMLTFLKGLATYEQEVRERLAEWKGFDVRY